MSNALITTTLSPLSQLFPFTYCMGIGRFGTRVAAALQQVATSSERGVALEKAAAWLVDDARMGREYKAMGVTGGVSGDTGEVWPFSAEEVQDNTKEESVDPPWPAT